MTNFLFILASAIATHEGYFHSDPTVAPRRNNNPGNLDFAGQPGASKAGRFAKFERPEQGIAALYRQLLKRIAEGKTLAELIAQYAPPSENNTSLYLSETTRRVGIDPNVPLWTYLTIERLS